MLDFSAALFLAVGLQAAHNLPLSETKCDRESSGPCSRLVLF